MFHLSTIFVIQGTFQLCGNRDEPARRAESFIKQGAKWLQLNIPVAPGRSVLNGQGILWSNLEPRKYRHLGHNPNMASSLPPE